MSSRSSSWTAPSLSVSPLFIALIVATPVVSLAFYQSLTRTSGKKIPDICHSVTGKSSTSIRKAEDCSPTTGNNVDTRRKGVYRIEEERKKVQSMEYTRRGQLWSWRASWHLPKAPRVSVSKYTRHPYPPGVERIKSILNRYEIDLNTGFLPSEDPLQRLPYARYHLWEDLGDDLPKLLGARLGQARAPLVALPPLSTDQLVTNAELKRAHLLLCLFAHAYIWGGSKPLDSLPEGIAKPLWEVSERLDIPPVLGHPSIVLYNWRRLDTGADICMENLTTLNNFFSGRDESWFYLITVEIEARGAPVILPMMLMMDAIQRYNAEKQVQQRLADVKAYSQEHLDKLLQQVEQQQTQWKLLSAATTSTSSAPNSATEEEGQDDEEYCDDEEEEEAVEMSDSAIGGGSKIPILAGAALRGELHIARLSLYVMLQLRKVEEGIKGMSKSLNNMREGCHPFIFYHRVRPFLSGWKHNPTLPQGIIYEGVNADRQQFYGGSAAQSALLPLLDIGLGVAHDSTKSRDFLMAMRDYMLKPHRDFLKYFETVACLKPFVEEAAQLAGIRNRSAKGEPSGADGTTGGAVTDTIGTTGATPNGKHAPPIVAEEAGIQKIVRQLCEAYDACAAELRQFRTIHIALVAEYIMAHQERKGQKGALESTAGGKGTGGTDLMNFLKPIRDDCTIKILEGANAATGATQDTSLESAAATPVDVKVPRPVKGTVPAAAALERGADAAGGTPASLDEDDVYLKDNGDPHDIDLYRGTSPGLQKSIKAKLMAKTALH